MITAIVLWFVLQIPLGIVVGKFLKASSDPLCAMDDPPTATPISDAPAAGELVTAGVCADVVLS
jgi:hypothetical protein